MLKKQEEPEGRLDGLMKVDTMEWQTICMSTSRMASPCILL